MAVAQSDGRKRVAQRGRQWRRRRPRAPIPCLHSPHSLRTCPGTAPSGCGSGTAHPRQTPPGGAQGRGQGGRRGAGGVRWSRRATAAPRPCCLQHHPSCLPRLLAPAQPPPPPHPPVGQLSTQAPNPAHTGHRAPPHPTYLRQVIHLLPVHPHAGQVALDVVLHAALRGSTGGAAGRAGMDQVAGAAPPPPPRCAPTRACRVPRCMPSFPHPCPGVSHQASPPFSATSPTQPTPAPPPAHHVGRHKVHLHARVHGQHVGQGAHGAAVGQVAHQPDLEGVQPPDLALDRVHIQQGLAQVGTGVGLEGSAAQGHRGTGGRQGGAGCGTHAGQRRAPPRLPTPPPAWGAVRGRRRR